PGSVRINDDVATLDQLQINGCCLFVLKVQYNVLSRPVERIMCRDFEPNTARPVYPYYIGPKVCQYGCRVRARTQAGEPKDGADSEWSGCSHNVLPPAR